MRTFVLRVGIVSFFLGASCLAQYEREGGTASEWPVYGGTADNRRFSKLSEINTSNVKNLTLAWVREFDGGPLMEATPVVVDGAMYIPAVSYRLDCQAAQYAVGGETKLYEFVLRSCEQKQKKPCGRLIFSRPFGHQKVGDQGVSAMFPTSRGIAAGRVGGKRKLFVALLDGTLCALVRNSLGIFVPDTQFGKAGCVKTIEPSDLALGASVTAAPAFYDHFVCLGQSGGDRFPGDGTEVAQGSMACFDAKNGHRMWQIHTAPPGGGGAPWMTPTVAKDSAVAVHVVFGTGNAWPEAESYPCTRAVVSAPLNGPKNSPCECNGQQKCEEFVFKTADANDYDQAAPPIALPGDKVFAAGKSGYAFVYSIVEKLRTNPRKIRFTTGDGNPGKYGGAAWGPGAYSAITKLVYFADNRCPGSCGGEASQPQGSFVAVDPEKLSVVARSHSLSVRLTDCLSSFSQCYSVPAVLFNGVVATQGGVVFAGESPGYLDAFDATDLSLLFHEPLIDPMKRTESWVVVSAPITFQSGGKQYVAITAGHQSANGIKVSQHPENSLDAVFVYSLPNGKGN
jgi:glucose dehydrogenase